MAVGEEFVRWNPYCEFVPVLSSMEQEVAWKGGKELLDNEKHCAIVRVLSTKSESSYGARGRAEERVTKAQSGCKDNGES